MVEPDPLMREIDDAVRHERYAQLWQTYRTPLLVIVGLLILITAGVSVQRELARQEAAAFSQSLLDAQQLLDSQKHDAAIAAFETMATQYGGTHHAIASLWKAKAQYAANQQDAAIDTLRNIANSAPASLWRDLACVQLLGTAAVPPACQHADNPAFDALMHTDRAARAAAKGEWETAIALLDMVAENDAAPLALQSQAAAWQALFLRAKLRGETPPATSPHEAQ
jgi:hypothetical protein